MEDKIKKLYELMSKTQKEVNEGTTAEIEKLLNEILQPLGVSFAIDEYIISFRETPLGKHQFTAYVWFPIQIGGEWVSYKGIWEFRKEPGYFENLVKNENGKIILKQTGKTPEQLGFPVEIFDTIKNNFFQLISKQNL